MTRASAIAIYGPSYEQYTTSHEEHDMTTGQRIASSGFGQFMASGVGRLLRIVAGIALIAWGISTDSTGGYVMAAIGVVPLLAGLLGICLLTGLIGGLWTGSSVKSCAARR